MRADHRFGGCLCGAVRFRVEGEPLWVNHCHCRSCRRSSGAAFLTWTGFRPEKFMYVRGRPVDFPSSPGMVRSFCGRCGSPLASVLERFPTEVHVTAGTFDDPGWLRPIQHSWASERLPWVHLADGLRQNPGFSPR